MWTRKELKQRGKEALKRNYWKIVLVSVLTMILGGGFGYSSGASGSGGINRVTTVEVAPEEAETDGVTDDDQTEMTVTDDGWTGMIVTEDGAVQVQGEANSLLDRTTEAIIEASEGMDEVATAVYIVAFLVIICLIILVIIVIAGAVAMFLFNPLRVGANRFMLKSVDDKAEIKELAYAFDHSYINVVKTMFHVDLRVFLWALLFVIPGIYKKYQYRMVPYILAEQPDMNYKEALQMSKDMMNGEKWHALVLDLSFVLWHMLGIITCGIVEIFYVNPYVELTDAALYRRLCELHDGAGQLALPDGNL